MTRNNLCVVELRTLPEVSGENFVMYERFYAPGFHDLILGMLRDAGIVPHISQTAAEIATVISLVDAQMDNGYFFSLSFTVRSSSTRGIGGDLQAISAQLHTAPSTSTFLARVYKVQHTLIALAHTIRIRIRK
jgi:hypothetical protein